MQTLDRFLKTRWDAFPERVALRQKISGSWREVTYAEVWEASGAIASGLLERGLRPGEHAALLGPSSIRWIECYLGILRAGGVVVPIDKELKSAELRHILADCEARFVFTEQAFQEPLIEALPSLPHLEQIVLMHHGSAHPDDPATTRALEALLAEWQQLVKSQEIPPEAVTRMEILARQLHRLLTTEYLRGRPAPDPSSAAVSASGKGEAGSREKVTTLGSLIRHTLPPASPRAPGDIAIILYTSGTTGRSKGAMLSHANIVSNLTGAVTHFQLDETIHTLSFLPINHVFEQVAGVLLPLSLGGKVSFAESLKKLGENLAEVRPTFLLGVPAVYKMLLDRIMKKIAARKTSRALYALPLTRRVIAAKVRKSFGAGTIFISGGAALDPAIAKGLLSFGIPVFQGYGITETSPVISAESPGGRRLGSVGTLFPGVEVRIDHPNEDGVGEIAVKGPNVMQGYFRNPEATSEVLQDGWYRTGDLGRVDPDGYLYICGRAKNLIVTPNGKNVYPEEVENELLKSRFIAEAMVYGHHVDPTHEEVHAIIHPNQEELDNYALEKGMGRMTVADVERLIREEVLKAGKNLADYKRVKRFTLREDEFPKTTTRKIKRFAVEASVSAHE
ncbi:hypothetical protein GMSM_12710 [Geomonas sp. Red276]